MSDLGSQNVYEVVVLVHQAWATSGCANGALCQQCFLHGQACQHILSRRSAPECENTWNKPELMSMHAQGVWEPAAVGCAEHRVPDAVRCTAKQHP